jgi:uncharacterized protein YjbJ (UPF0337 family)
VDAGDMPASAADANCGSTLFAAARLVYRSIFSTKGTTSMTWEQIKGDWKQLSGKLKEKWGKLTDDDLVTIDGKRLQLAGVLQERYGFSQERADKELENFIRRLTS